MSRNKLNEKSQETMQESDKKITKLDEVVSDMESKMMLLGVGSGGAGADMKVFEIMIHKLRKEFRNRFITTEELEESEQKVMKEVDKVNELENSMKEFATKLDLYRKQLDNMVDKKDLKYELDRLHSNVRSIGSRMNTKPAGDGENIVHDSEFDMSNLGPFEDKLSSLEEGLNGLRIQMKTSEEKLKLECRDLKLNKYDYSTGKELKSSVEKLLSRLDEVDKSVKSCINKTEDEIEALIIERIKPIEEDSKGHGDIILQITQRIQRMEVKIENINKITNAQKGKNDGLDVDRLKSAELSIKTLTNDVEVIKKDLAKKVEDLFKSIYFKCDKSEVASLESKLLDNLEDLVQSMYKKFSDKSETNENLQILDKQLKNLFELVVSKEKQVDKEARSKDDDDAMISRKPLGGSSCISCSKNVTNMYEKQQTEFFSWSKMPMRDPTDRMSKVGQGFSKMLSSIKTKAEASKIMEGSKEINTHLNSTDLRREDEQIETIHVPSSKEEKSRNKHLSPFKTFDIAQRTARERKVKKLDKIDSHKKARDESPLLPTIIKSMSVNE